jgi:hypothetical protein
MHDEEIVCWLAFQSVGIFHVRNIRCVYIKFDKRAHAKNYLNNLILLHTDQLQRLTFHECKTLLLSNLSNKTHRPKVIT